MLQDPPPCELNLGRLHVTERNIATTNIDVWHLDTKHKHQSPKQAKKQT